MLAWRRGDTLIAIKPHSGGAVTHLTTPVRYPGCAGRGDPSGDMIFILQPDACFRSFCRLMPRI
jgi:hypothetical protein